MENKKPILKASKVMSMSETTRAKITAIAKEIKGKDLFPAKVAMAKKSLSSLTSLPR